MKEGRHGDIEPAEGGKVGQCFVQEYKSSH